MLTGKITIQDLVEAGVHFGHRLSRWNPKMKPYIYGTKNQIHIIDLRYTLRGLIRGAHFLTRLAATGREVVFVSTKRQAKAIIRREAERCGMHWVTERWLGGTLTNHATIIKRLKRLEELERLEATGEIEKFSKKMISSLRRERRKILRNLEGIRRMKLIPGAMIVVDVRREAIAVREANKMGVVVIGLVDTDSDPTGVDIIIPGNDDAYRAIEIVVKYLTDAIIAGRDKLIEGAAIAQKREELPEEAAPEEAAGAASPEVAAGVSPAPSPSAAVGEIAEAAEDEESA